MSKTKGAVSKKNEEKIKLYLKSIGVDVDIKSDSKTVRKRSNSSR